MKNICSECGQNLKVKSEFEIDSTLPFFSYGFFRPGEISYLGINDFVNSAVALSIEGDLVLRDGVTLFKDSKTQKVEGFLISFLPEFANEAVFPPKN